MLIRIPTEAECQRLIARLPFSPDDISRLLAEGSP
jgi:hypothetical protein